MTLFRWPDRAAQKQRLSKDQILTRAKIAGVRVSPKARAELNNSVARVDITYLLNPQTTNLPTHGPVKDILILSVTLKTDIVPETLIHLIDRTLPRATLFECIRPDGQGRTICAYKRPSDADTQRWVSEGELIQSEWTDGTEKRPLPQALHLAGLYEALIQSLLPHSRRKEESLSELMARMAKIATLEKRIATLERQVARERQPNRRVEANEALKEAQTQWQSLIAP